MYNIEKKTPASNWYTIHRGFSQIAAVDFLADISKQYDDNLIHSEVEADLAAQIADRGFCEIGAYETDEDGSQGDYHQYRAVAA